MNHDWEDCGLSKIDRASRLWRCRNCRWVLWVDAREPDPLPDQWFYAHVGHPGARDGATCDELVTCRVMGS